MQLRPFVRPFGLAFALVVGWGGPSTAQEGTSNDGSTTSRLSAGRFVVGVERVTGVIGWHTRSNVENDFGRFERRRWGGQFHLLSATGNLGDGHDGLNVSGVPRVAFDVVTRLGLTVGAYGGVLGSTGIEELTIDGVDQPRIDFPDMVTALGGVRAGYVLSLSRSVAFWPRVGVGYAVQKTYGNGGLRQTIQAWQLNIEPMFVLSPVSHVGFLIQPMVDVGFAGSLSTSFVISGLPTQSSQGSHRAHGVGLAAGLVAIF